MLDAKTISVAFLATMLVGCGGEGTTSAPPIITVPAFAPATPVAAPAPTPPPPPSTLTTSLSVRQNGVDYYQSGWYIALNNNWGADKFGMVMGKDYTQKITYTPSLFPGATEFVWDYPDTPHGNGSEVYGYPSVAFGQTTLGLTGYNTNNAIAQVKNITKFTELYDVTLGGDLQYMNLMHNMFFFGPDGKTAGEITFNVYPNDHIKYWADPANFFGQQAGAHSHQVTMDGVRYNILVAPAYGIPDKKMFLVIPLGDSKTVRGTIDWMTVFDALDDDHDISPDWFVKGVEMGVEVQAGNGSMKVNDFRVQVTYYNPTTATYTTIN